MKTINLLLSIAMLQLITISCNSDNNTTNTITEEVSVMGELGNYRFQNSNNAILIPENQSFIKEDLSTDRAPIQYSSEYTSFEANKEYAIYLLNYISIGNSIEDPKDGGGADIEIG